MRTARSLLAAALLLSAVLTVSAEKVTTKHKCYYDGSWSDVCWYKDICFRGSPSNLVFITDDPEEVYISPPSLAAKIFATTKMLRQIHGMPRVNRPGPIHYKVHQTEVMSTADYEAGALGEVTWVDRTLWIPSYFEVLGNIWFYATRVLPLFTANMYKEQWDLPDMEDILLYAPGDKVDHSWHDNMLNASIVPGTKVYYENDAPYNGLKEKTWCFKKAVLLGSNMYGFPDMMSAYEFRRQVYKSLDIPLLPFPAPPKHVTILDRERKRSRHLENINEVMGILAKYGITPEYVVVTGNSTFEEQVRLMARTGLLITAHGAGLMNEIFLPPGAAVMEIFPVHLKHVLYERIAHYAGIFHFKVYCREFVPGFHTQHPEYRDLECDDILSLSVSDNAECWGLIKNSNLNIPLPEFEVAFANALDHIGIRTKLKGIASKGMKDTSQEGT